MTAARPTGSARLRQLERHGAASLRALSGKPMAEYRASRLRLNGQPAAFAAPWLNLDFQHAALTRSRGVIDSMGLRLRYSDLALHRDLNPAHGFARVVFDVLEQLRCESLLLPALRGLRGNLDAAFVEWCQEAHINGLVENESGILLYTVIHMVRARLLGTIEDAVAEALIEATRATLAPLIGSALYRLSSVREDQAAFAEPAREIADALQQLTTAVAGDANKTRDLKELKVFVLPPDWEDGDPVAGVEAIGGATAGAASVADERLETVGDYHIFTTEFDATVTGTSLYRDERRAGLRAELDQLVAAQAVSVPRLARELQQLFGSPQVDGWLFGQDEGLIDARRLSQLVSNPQNRSVFLRERLQTQGNAVVTFLIDNSGSMKSQRFAAVAVLVDTFCRALTLAGVGSEVLGFTTRGWNGGRVLKAWRRQRSPGEPGRLGETLHIVYKSADISWRRSRSSLASLLDTRHFREGVDGEALIWAYRRLQARSEARRYLVLVSDGAPMDAATHNANRVGFLNDHLIGVARHIDSRSLRDPNDIQLGAIGIDLDLSEVFSRSVSLDLSGTLGRDSYRVLRELFESVH